MIVLKYDDVIKISRDFYYYFGVFWKTLCGVILIQIFIAIGGFATSPRARYWMSKKLRLVRVDVPNSLCFAYLTGCALLYTISVNIIFVINFRIHWFAINAILFNQLSTNFFTPWLSIMKGSPSCKILQLLTQISYP